MSARAVQPGARPTVVVEQAGRVEELHARLVVGADGCGSLVRTWTGSRAAGSRTLTDLGVLYDEMWTPQEDTGYYVMNPSLGQAARLFLRARRVRAYLVHTKATSVRLQEPQLCPALWRSP